MDVSVSWSYAKKDRETALAKMNEIASSKTKNLGFQFNFKPVEKDTDLDLGITVPRFEELFNRRNNRDQLKLRPSK